MKKSIVLFTIAVMCLYLFACGGDSDSANTTDTTKQTEDSSQEIDDNIEENEQESGFVHDDDDLGEFNFEGATINVFNRSLGLFNGNLDVEEMTGDILNDAKYVRNRAFEERFNFVFNNIIGGDNSNVVRTSFNAGENFYDFALVRNTEAFSFAQNGLIHGLDSFIYIDLDKSYWDKTINDSLMVANERYFATGSFNLTPYDFMHVLLFNKQLLQDLGLDDPYQMVKDGTWTIDRFEEMAKTATVDMNGDGMISGNSDSYGFLANTKQVSPSFWIGMGVQGIIKDENNYPQINLESPEFVNVFEKIFTVIRDTGIWYKPQAIEANLTELDSMFQAGQALFYDNTFFFIERLRGMETDFGLLPYPKLTETQDKYYMRVEGCELFVAPLSQPDDIVERASVIIEGLASSSAKTVVPAYYELALKTKNVRDEQSAEIIDMLFENLIFDFADTVWCPEIRDGFINSLFFNNDRNIVSRTQKSLRVIERNRDKMVETFENLK